ncbi:hypothetical protein FA15DRAFT_670632 [Coprinopsis marcescibilis]|uniref:Integral membrane protein n=1 Tax=Coprinopsis marcescibilis TaxID=230819 RepID=A0A5C3KS42_COPMA|nr:hypothetical protein FA15DRAFT_670632 [Coprinopsis marcescibilis]
MPSIRVKSAQHPHVRDLFHPSISESNQGHGKVPDSPTFRRQQDSHGTLHKPISMPNFVNDVEDIDNTTVVTAPTVTGTGTSSGRPRSNTAASRIRTHVLERGRESRLLQDPTVVPLVGNSSIEAPGRESVNFSPRTSAAHPSSLIRLDGAQADVFVESEGQPGLLEDAFKDVESLSRRQQKHNRNQHDDIIEHLDVIDPQISTVSKLTNAANSIVIPRTSLYSRKPVIVLPSSTRPRRDSSQPEYEDPLDRHVDDVLQSPSRVRRTLLGIWSFVKTPIGILTAIYGFLVVFWGAAIVFFLAKIINLHNPDLQGFWVEVSSQVVCGLFTVTSVGFIPNRILSTYRIYKVWDYKRKTIKRRKEAGLPQLFDQDDLPDPQYDPNFVHVLTDEEHQDLHRQQIKFTYHQTWYRAHGTETHRAFPISTALWICFLNDANSIFQIILCGTMWGMNRFQRPPWSTGILIPAGFLCGIGSAVLIWRGGERTKRIEEVRKRLQAVLNEAASLTPAEAEDEQRPQLTESPETAYQDQPRFATIKFADREPLDVLSDSIPPIVDEEMTIPRTIP